MKVPVQNAQKQSSARDAKARAAALSIGATGITPQIPCAICDAGYAACQLALPPAVCQAAYALCKSQCS